MTLEQKIKICMQRHKEMIAADEFLTGTWWKILDADVEEMRAYAKKKRILSQFQFCETRKCMVLQQSCDPVNFTLFVHSVPVRVDINYVVDSAYINK